MEKEVELHSWVFSPSALSLYDDCAYAWYLMYGLGINPYEKPSPAILLGNAFHECVKKFLGSRLQTQKWLFQLWKMHRLVSVREKMSGDMGIDYFWKWFKRMRAKGWKVKGVEQRFENQLFGTKIKGRMDALFVRFDKYLVVDWKTGNSDIRSSKDMNDFIRNQIQIFLYGLVVAERYELNFDKVELGLYYPMHDKFVSCSLEDSVAGNRVEKCLEGIAVHDYSKNLSAACEWCSFKDFCR